MTRTFIWKGRYYQIDSWWIDDEGNHMVTVIDKWASPIHVTTRTFDDEFVRFVPVCAYCEKVMDDGSCKCYSVDGGLG